MKVGIEAALDMSDARKDTINEIYFFCDRFCDYSADDIAEEIMFTQPWSIIQLSDRSRIDAVFNFISDLKSLGYKHDKS